MELPTITGGRGPRFLRHTGKVALLEATTGGSPSPDALRSVYERAKGASLLLTTADLDPGDDPHATAELVSRGIRAVIAPGFESGFYERCFGDGLLPVLADVVSIQALAAHLADHPDAEMTVDLEMQVIECDGMESTPFDVDPRGRNKLLLGLSDLDEMTRNAAKTAEMRVTDRARRPWLYRSP